MGGVIFDQDNLKADECLFVDDSLKNTEAAASVGIHGLHIKTNEDWMDPLQEVLKEANK